MGLTLALWASIQPRPQTSSDWTGRERKTCVCAFACVVLNSFLKVSEPFSGKVV